MKNKISMLTVFGMMLCSCASKNNNMVVAQNQEQKKTIEEQNSEPKKPESETQKPESESQESGVKTPKPTPKDEFFIANRLEKLSKDTKFNSDIGIIDLKNEGDKWQFTVKDLANQTFTFDVKNLKKAGIFDETEFTKMNFGAEIDTKLKIVRNNELSYTHYGFLEHLTKDNHGKPATVYNSFIIHEKDKEVDFQTPEKETTFMGSTYAMLTINKNGVYSYDTLNGTATMTVGAGQTVGDIKMAYNNWKTITAKNVNLTNGAVGGWEINDNKLDFTKEDGGFGPHKSVLSVTILDNKEIAGSYKAIMHDKLITPENRVAYTVDGVFGMKK